TAPPKPFAAAAVNPSRMLNVIGLMWEARRRGYQESLSYAHDYENFVFVAMRDSVVLAENFVISPSSPCL
ncbi:MAG TPA: hypothetical protein VI685_13500, partial [Candidatus Angelobacter sp.]